MTSMEKRLDRGARQLGSGAQHTDLLKEAKEWGVGTLSCTRILR